MTSEFRAYNLVLVLFPRDIHIYVGNGACPFHMLCNFVTPSLRYEIIRILLESTT